MTRRIKFDRKIIDQICLYVENGNSNKDACLLAGVAESTFYNWLKEATDFEESNKKAKPKIKADEYIQLCLELLESLKKAEVKFKSYHISNINDASKRAWQASAWMLERRYHKEFGRTVEFENPDGTPVTTPLATVHVYIPSNGRESLIEETPDGD